MDTTEESGAGLADFFEVGNFVTEDPDDDDDDDDDDDSLLIFEALNDLDEGDFIPAS